MSTLVCAVVGLGLMGAGASTADAAGKATKSIEQLGPVKVGEKLPTWAGHSPTGEMVRFSEILKPRRGEPPKAMVISFFGTWCQPCRIGLRTIQKVMNETQGYKTVLIAKPPKLNTVKPFLRSLGVNQLVINDTHEKISVRLGVTAEIPRTIVIGADGVVRAIFSEEGGDFEMVLKKALSDAALKSNISGTAGTKR